jgi:ABC-type sugar transport system ATPase subunit
MSFLTVENISKSVGDRFRLSNLNFSLDQGITLAIAGATGSGKSTLLKIIAGMHNPDEGQVYFEGNRVKRVPEEKLLPGHPGIGWLSQYFELRNHHRMSELLQYANVLSDKEAEKIYEVCDVAHLLERTTAQLSGGEQQRIALARQLVTAPKLLILDEPFSNLDLPHKEKLKKVLDNVRQELSTTLILVTHEPSDLLSMADRLMLMKDGAVIQDDTAFNCYHQPASAYAASLLGACNLLKAKEVKALWPSLTVPSADQLYMTRPEYLTIQTRPGKSSIAAEVTATRFLGYAHWLELKMNNLQISCLYNKDKIPGKGSKVYLSGDAPQGHWVSG